MTAPDYSRYPAAAVPWPAAIDWSSAELRSYLADAADPGAAQLPTRCPPWTVSDLTAHLAATFQRFADQLARARAGSLAPPFERDQLSSENLRAVREFRGDSVQALADHAQRFLRGATAGSAADLMGHQLGPIPVGLQVMFGLSELVVHHDDLAAATGHSFRPADEIVTALAAMRTAAGGLADGTDTWLAVLRGTGR